MPTTTRSAGSDPPVRELDLAIGDGGGRLAEVEDDSVLLVEFADEVAGLGAEDPFEGSRVRGDDVDLEAALAQRGGDFQPDEACADDDHSPSRAGGGDDRAAVGERPQVVDVRE